MSMDNVPFQSQDYSQEDGTFKSELQGLVLRVHDSISSIRTIQRLEPQNRREGPQDREPYKLFFSRFSAFIESAQDIIEEEDPKLVDDVHGWLRTTSYKTTSKKTEFEMGFAYFRKCRRILYRLGIIDLNVPKTTRYPFKDIVHELEAECESN